MAVSANCPGCKTQFKLSDSLLGKKVRCKRCGQAFMAGDVTGRQPLAGETAENPHMEETEPSPLSASGLRRLRDERFKDDDAAERKRKEEQKAFQRKMLTYGGIGAVVLVFLGLLVAGFNSMDSEEKAKTKKAAAPADPGVVTPGPVTVTPNVKPPSTTATTSPMPNRPMNVAPPKMPNAAKGMAMAKAPSAKPEPPAPLSLDPTAADDDRPVPVPPPLKWQMKEDAPAAALKPVAATRRPVALAGDQHVIVPSTPSNFAALAGNAGADFTAKLLTPPSPKPGKPLTIKPALADPVALDPDGTQLAGSVNSPSGGTDVDVWSFTTGKRVRLISVDKQAGGLELLDFAQPGRLVVLLKRDDGKRVVQVWDIAKGTSPLHQMDGPAEYAPQSAALSPGRRYLALGEGEKVTVYDLGSGTVTAEVKLPKPAERAGKQECNGLAFSPDGAELAGLFSNTLNSRVIAWEVAKGGVVADHSFDVKLRATFKGPALQWLMGRSGWLVYGRTLVEHDTGRLVESPALDQEHDRRVVGRGDSILEVVESARAMSIRPVPRDVVVIFQDTQRKWAALRPPPAAAGDLAAARPLPAPDGTRWSYQQDASPSRGEVASRPFPVQPKEADVQRVLFSRPDVGQVALISSAFPSEPKAADKAADAAPGESYSKKVVRVDRYDVSSGKSLGSGVIHIDPQYRSAGGPAPADLSPDGRYLALKVRHDPRRADVWNVADGRYVIGWLPYGQLSDSGANEVSWLALVDQGHALTLNPTGKLVLWTLPACRPMYSIDNVAKNAVALSPNRKYIAVLQGNAFCLYATTTGEAVGRLPWPAPIDAGNPLLGVAAAFTRNGGRLAAAVGGRLVCWDMRGGKEVASFPVGQEFTELTWCDKDHLLGSNQREPDKVFLVSLERECVLCRYRPPADGGKSALGPDGRLWVLQGGAKEGSLVPFTLPDTRAASLEQTLADPQCGTLLRPAAANQPGTGVSVRVSGGSGSLNASLQQHLSARLKSLGLEPADGQGVTLNFEANPTGQKLACTVSLTGPGGTYWTQETFDRTANPERLCVQYADIFPIPNRVVVINGQATALPETIPLDGTDTELKRQGPKMMEKN